MLPMDTIDGIPVLRPRGRFDAYKVPAIDASMETIFEEAEIPRVIVDFMQVQFIDSAALDALLKWLNSAHERKGDIKLSALRQTVRMRLDVRHLTAFKIYENDVQAAAAFHEEADEADNEASEDDT